MDLRKLSIAAAVACALACSPPPAARGPQGPAGERGPQGEPGTPAPGIKKGDVQYLSTAVDGKAGEEPIAFVVCSPHDVLLSGGCVVKADGPYELLTNGPDNMNDASKPA